MPLIERMKNSEQFDGEKRAEWGLLLGISAIVATIHQLTNGRYGFHPDELQFLSDARHLDWGFVPYPPLTPLLGRIGLGMFGVSVAGVRLFSVLAQAAVIVVTGLMAYELGGGRLAQITGALCVALSSIPVIYGTQLQYSCFDFLWWVLISYFTIRLLRSENPRWWLAVGAAAGIGMETKYSVAFFGAGILCGAALTRARHFFKSGWFWCGIALALTIFLPNLLWLARHDFISYRFLEIIHERDLGVGNANGFLQNQFLFCVNVVAAPLWLAGLVCFLRSPRYRMLAWMYLIPLVLFLVAEGRSYYLAPAYPMLLAMGSVAAEAWFNGTWKVPKATGPQKTKQTKRLGMRFGALAVAVIFFTALALDGSWIYAINVPFQSRGRLKEYALKRNADFLQEFGWDEMVRTVAGIRDSLPASQKADVGILVDDYAEQGAIEILGAQYHLSPPISLVNSGWLRGYPALPPTSLIVLGFSQQDADVAFTACKLAGHINNSEGVRNEESKTPDIFLCGPPRLPWPVFWKEFQVFD
ncbi:MAG: glycosyltransferase family 39 protein [Terracidiphilus sp.]